MTSPASPVIDALRASPIGSLLTPEQHRSLAAVVEL